ncbi:Hypothetical predicted protein [Pelobates cultripes]|uniref:L1 transposable element RRM domain-containing protein n=1 Tax=Pelobates cultripes TaxID=61616 RepID=A0AAD1VWB9_PELCU|nr:Hypothetical predicted protein [Pelobates cultripes]
MFRTKEDRQPSWARSQENSGAESEESEHESTHASPLTQEVLRKMLKETSADIKAYTTAALEKQIAGLKSDIEALASRTGDTERTLQEIQTKAADHGRDMGILKDRILFLEDGMEDLNNRSRRQNIRIRGLAESVMPEAILPTITAIFQSLLPDNPGQTIYIERAHRALRPPFPNTNTPRDVIVKLLHFPVKEQLMKAARDRPPVYQGQQLQFYQDLAPSTLRKRRELKPLTTALLEAGWRYTWGHPFRITVKKGDQTYSLHQVSDMRDFATHLGIQLRCPTADPQLTINESSGRRNDSRANMARTQPKKKASTASQEHPHGHLNGSARCAQDTTLHQVRIVAFTPKPGSRTLQSRHSR